MLPPLDQVTEFYVTPEETDTEDADAEETKSELKDQLGNLLNSDKETEETGKDETVYMIAHDSSLSNCIFCIDACLTNPFSTASSLHDTKLYFPAA